MSGPETAAPEPGPPEAGNGTGDGTGSGTGDGPEDQVTAGGCVLLLAVVLLVMGLLGLAAGALFANIGPSDPDLDEVRCGDDVMARGDTCIVFGGGPEDGGSYEEVADQQRGQARTHAANHRRASVALRTGGFLLAASLVLYVAGYATLARGERRRRAHDPSG